MTTPSTVIQDFFSPLLTPIPGAPSTDDSIARPWWNPAWIILYEFRRNSAKKRWITTKGYRDIDHRKVESSYKYKYCITRKICTDFFCNKELSRVWSSFDSVSPVFLLKSLPLRPPRIMNTRKHDRHNISENFQTTETFPRPSRGE